MFCANKMYAQFWDITFFITVLYIFNPPQIPRLFIPKTLISIYLNNNKMHMCVASPSPQIIAKMRVVHLSVSPIFINNVVMNNTKMML